MLTIRGKVADGGTKVAQSGNLPERTSRPLGVAGDRIVVNP